MGIGNTEGAIRTVLVADDDELFLAACRRGCEPPTELVTTASAASTLQLALERAPDVVIVDLRLGRDSGIELIRALRGTLPRTKIALVSGYLSVALAATAIRAGADATLFKPISFIELMRQLEIDQSGADANQVETPTLARAEWEHITRVLTDCNGNVSQAARRLGILRQALQRRLRKYPPRV